MQLSYETNDPLLIRIIVNDLNVDDILSGRQTDDQCAIHCTKTSALLLKLQIFLHESDV